MLPRADASIVPYSGRGDRSCRGAQCAPVGGYGVAGTARAGRLCRMAAIVLAAKRAPTVMGGRAPYGGM